MTTKLPYLLISTQLKIKSKKNRLYRSFKISPDGNLIAFVEHYHGQYKVKIHDIKKNKTNTIFKR